MHCENSTHIHFVLTLCQGVMTDARNIDVSKMCLGPGLPDPML